VRQHVLHRTDRAGNSGHRGHRRTRRRGSRVPGIRRQACRRDRACSHRDGVDHAAITSRRILFERGQHHAQLFDLVRIERTIGDHSGRCEPSSCLGERLVIEAKIAEWSSPAEYAQASARPATARRCRGRFRARARAAASPRLLDGEPAHVVFRPFLVVDQQHASTLGSLGQVGQFSALVELWCSPYAPCIPRRRSALSLRSLRRWSRGVRADDLAAR